MTENEQHSICYLILQVLNQCILFPPPPLNHFSFAVFYFYFIFFLFKDVFTYPSETDSTCGRAEREGERISSRLAPSVEPDSGLDPKTLSPNRVRCLTECTTQASLNFFTFEAESWGLEVEDKRADTRFLYQDNSLESRLCGVERCLFLVFALFRLFTLLQL